MTQIWEHSDCWVWRRKFLKEFSKSAILTHFKSGDRKELCNPRYQLGAEPCWQISAWSAQRFHRSHTHLRPSRLSATNHEQPSCFNSDWSFLIVKNIVKIPTEHVSLQWNLLDSHKFHFFFHSQQHMHLNANHQPLAPSRSIVSWPKFPKSPIFNMGQNFKKSYPRHFIIN